MSLDTGRVRKVLAGISGRDVLLEPEGLAILQAMGVAVPKHVVVTHEDQVTPEMLAGLGSERVVLKILSPRILHRTDVGGVKLVPNRPAEVTAALAALRKKFEAEDLQGLLVAECVPFDKDLGNELLLGMRWTGDFGPVVTFGAGGIYAEFLASSLRPGREVAIFSPALEGTDIAGRLDEVAMTALVCGGLRDLPPRVSREALEQVVRAFLELAREFLGRGLLEFEVNPLVISGGRFVALDALARTGTAPAAAPPRPLARIRNLLEPKTAAIIGVSEKLNPGHIILNNLLREGFDPEAISIVKPDSDRIEGCRCYPDIASLPGPVDLFILAVSAAQAPDVIREIVERRRAESLIIIPGGLEEKEGTEAIIAQMKGALAAARNSEWGGPVINGGNCLGIRSLPGHYDTMFIPEIKMPIGGPAAPVALISNSGAFAIARLGQLLATNPRFVATLGNQMDLTVGDYLTYLKDDPEVDVFAVYVEGFRPLDGLQFLKAAREITAGGRTVILYRAGRTAAGRKATASHTAAIAGDYVVTRELARQAGVVLAETLEDFQDLVRLFARLKGFPVNGFRLGALSNAGFECVALADNVGPFELAPFTAGTRARLQRVFEKARIQDIVDVHNPVDLTPMCGDEAYEEAIRAVLEDETVDVGVVGCVPLTPALQTLPPGPGHREDLYAPTAFASRLLGIQKQVPKAWVVVIDGGPVFDPLARHLEEQGLPVFRAADRALRLFATYCEARLHHGGRRLKGR